MPRTVFTWPNLITILRLLLLPPFIWLMILAPRPDWTPTARHLALGIFLFMAGSDFLDGWLARRLGRTSNLGAILDPLADKLLITTSVVLLALPGTAVANLRLPSVVLMLIIAKDLWISLGAALLYRIAGRTHFRAGLAGKVTTAVQLIMVVAMLLWPDAQGLPGYRGFVEGTWVLAGALAVMTAAAYTVREVREFRRERRDAREWLAGEPAQNRAF